MPLLKHRLAEMYNQHAALEGEPERPTRFPQLAGNGDCCGKTVIAKKMQR